MRKPIYNSLDVYEAFQDVIDSDFNPDIVHVALIDMWDEGYKCGIKTGIAMAGIGFGIIFVGCKIRKYIKYKKSERRIK